MEKSAKMVLVVALFLAALSAVPSQGRALPKQAQQPGAKAYHPQNFVGGFGGGVFVPGTPPMIGGATVFGPLPGGGFGVRPFASGIPGIANMQPVGSGDGVGGGIGGIGGVGHP